MAVGSFNAKMERWQVTESDTESSTSSEDVIDFRGVKIPPSKLLEICHSLEKRRTLELDCLLDTRRKVMRRKIKCRRSKAHSPQGPRNPEEVSETASLSTASTTDCRNVRR